MKEHYTMTFKIPNKKNCKKTINNFVKDGGLEQVSRLPVSRRRACGKCAFFTCLTLISPDSAENENFL